MIGEPFRPLAGVEIGDRRRQQQQRGGEDRRNDARGVELERQMRGLPLEHAVADLALRILDQQTPLRALHEDDEGDDGDHHHHDDEDQAGRERTLAAEFERAGDRGGKLRDDARHDDQRHAVADAALGDLLAEPHQEHGAAGKRDHGRDAKEHARIGDDVAGAFKADGDAVGLERRQHDGQVAGVLVDGLAPGLALLLERLEGRRHRRHQLDDDRRGDVGHDVQREDRHAVNAAAGEHVEHPQNTAGLGIENLVPGGRGRCRAAECRCRADRPGARRA